MTKKCGCCGSTNLVEYGGDWDRGIDYFLCLDCHHIDSFLGTNPIARGRLDSINESIAKAKSIEIEIAKLDQELQDKKNSISLLENKIKELNQKVSELNAIIADEDVSMRVHNQAVSDLNYVNTEIKRTNYLLEDAHKFVDSSYDYYLKRIKEKGHR